MPKKRISTNRVNIWHGFQYFRVTDAKTALPDVATQRIQRHPGLRNLTSLVFLQARLGAAFRVKGSGFRVEGSEFRVED